MVSVAIATYNGEKYILDQLKSIFNQSHPVDEVIITDDRSTDDTIKIINNFISENRLTNWHVYINEENLGFSSNFFRAVKMTKGDVIFLSDQDDVWEENKVEVMASIMFSNKEIQLLSSNYTLIDGANEQIHNKQNARSITKNEATQIVPYNFFIGNSNFLGCSMCIRKDLRVFLLTHDNLELNLSLGHDWYFSIVAAAIGSFSVINKPLFKRRVHESNSSMAELRKTTILASTKVKRITYFEQIITAHKLLLSHNVLKTKIIDENRTKTHEMVRFYEKRLAFMNSGNLLTWISLFFGIGKYYQNAKSYKGAVRMYIGDLLYAYNINWKL
ncbi:MAG: hypothetical protein DA407_07915 [Bacteroidetes bacterium]|nr:MAG: hypothetical protein DA407_07915 [Bacteroidota bacterium]